MKPLLRPMTAADWPSVAEIYKQGIEGGNATFQLELPTWAEWDKAHLQKCRMVAELNNKIAGWIALSPISGRSVFVGVAEVSIYISNQYQGQKIGSQLLNELINESEKENIWTLESKIFPENNTSIRLHEKFGFRIVGYRNRIGKMKNIWRNIVVMERRSEKTGL
ncbi:MAG: GNAT family N-acetyltransferase [Sphingobacteriaceae bacterium]|nr:GNAT family N-acetyltransferase [Sphingobacteriaceae bacterium]